MRAVRKQLQTIALLSLAHFDYERADVSQFVSQFVSHFRLHSFALAVNLQDAPDTSAKVIRARTRSSFSVNARWLDNGAIGKPRRGCENVHYRKTISVSS